MKYSVSFNHSKKDEIDEIKVKFNQLGYVYDYMREHPEKRYNIFLDTDYIPENLEEQIEFVKNVVSDYTIACTKFAVLFVLLKQGYNAYINFPISDWETFSGLADAGVSDILIDGCIGFSCNELSKVEKVIIRANPCNSTSRVIAPHDCASSFYIRPEDVEIYENYIDIFEFEKEKEESLYTFYKQKYFPFDLQLLINNFNISCNNELISTSFVKKRINCKQVCKNPSVNCEYCKHSLNISNSILHIGQTLRKLKTKEKKDN